MSNGVSSPLFLRFLGTCETRRSLSSQTCSPFTPSFLGEILLQHTQEPQGRSVPVQESGSVCLQPQINPVAPVQGGRACWKSPYKTLGGARRKDFSVKSCKASSKFRFYLKTSQERNKLHNSFPHYKFSIKYILQFLKERFDN